ncbi:protein SNORC [Amia ocellicauda]|uniref:protein SNORC n=1 Tax=Amia ocellicauda TaxID=2972642 RepID=UPI003464919F
MASSKPQRFFLLTLLGLWMATARTETVAEPSPTPHSENLETTSGAGAYDITTRYPLRDHTDYVIEYVDTTHSMDQPMDHEESVLGPGAIAAIVIAVILGASVLIALIVITLKKFTTA